MKIDRILILADSGLAAALGEGLRGHGFRVEATAALDAALALAGALGFDAAVVDRAALGVRTGPALASLAAALAVPICLLAPPARRSLAAAANVACVLPKPVRLQALAAALRGLSKPAAASPAAASPGIVLPGTRFEFRSATRRLVDRKTGRETQLTETETDLLAALRRAAGRPVMREDLLRAVWGYNSKVSTRTLETHIYRLRRKLERAPARAKLLETVPGGYRLSPRGKEVLR